VATVTPVIPAAGTQNKGDFALRQTTITQEGIEEMCEQTIKDMAFSMLERIKQQVALGFAEPAEIVDDAVGYFSDKRPEELLQPIAEHLVKIAIAKHMAAQENWPAETDCDRLDSAFAELEQNGIFCRQDYMDCQTCGRAELTMEMLDAVQAGGMPRGYCFFHNQDTDRVLETGLLYLAYGSGPGSEEIGAARKEIAQPTDDLTDSPAYEQAALTIGHEIAATLRRHGFTVRWTESVGARIAVQIDWQRRREVVDTDTLLQPDDTQGHREPDGAVAAPMKWGEFVLPYADGGEVKFLDTAQSARDALDVRADDLDETAADLRAIMDAIKDHDVNMELGADYLLLFGPAALIDDLMANDELDRPVWEYEEFYEAEEVTKQDQPEPLHRTVRVQWGNLDAHIDEYIAPLILELWKAGFATRNSCEGHGSAPVWISFARVADVETFLNIVRGDDDGAEALSGQVEETSATGGAHAGWWKYDVHLDRGARDVDRAAHAAPAEPNRFRFSMSVRFPRADVPVVVDRMKHHNKGKEESPASV